MWSKKARFNWEDRGAKGGLDDAGNPRTFKGKDGLRQQVDTTVDGSASDIRSKGRNPDQATGIARGPDPDPVVAAAQPTAAPLPAPAASQPDASFMASADALAEHASGRTRTPITAPYSNAAAERLAEMLDEIHEATNGRVNKAMALEAAADHGLSEGPRGALSATLAGVVGLRQTARMVAEAAKSGGRVTGRQSGLLKRMGIRAGQSAARAGVLANPMGKAAMAGAVSVAAGHMLGAAFGMVGGLAVSAGKAKKALVIAGDALLGGKGSRVAAVTLTAAYTYGDAEPTTDVTVRVQQLQAAASNPEMARNAFMERLGDLALLTPDVAQAAAENHVRQLQNLSIKAPRFMWDQFGRPKALGSNEVRRFREAEDATWRFEETLKRIGAGSASRTEAETFRVQFPVAAAILVQDALSDPARVAKAPKASLLILERLAGMPLTHMTPEFAIRQQQSYAPAEPTQQNMTALSAPPSTPAQAARAPGN